MYKLPHAGTHIIGWKLVLEKSQGLLEFTTPNLLLKSIKKKVKKIRIYVKMVLYVINKIDNLKYLFVMLTTKVTTKLIYRKLPYPNNQEIKIIPFLLKGKFGFLKSQTLTR